MADQQVKRGKGAGASTLFSVHGRKRHPHLFLRKYLAEEANKLPIAPAELERVTAALKKWAEAALEGHLNQKETTLDAEFMQKIFGEALNYKTVSESPSNYHREKNPTVPGVGIADGALGMFISGQSAAPTAIIELKGAAVDLDHDKSNGRTPVQQLWDYLVNLPDTQWGIVSNYVTIRLYHKSATPRTYEEFTVADFHDPDRVRQFYYVFEREGLLGNRAAKEGTRATRLLRQTQNQQREVGDELYKYYASNREQLIGELIDRKGFTQDVAIRVAQKLLDRIIFMAFCEDRGLLPDKLIESTWKNVAPLARATNPRWNNFLDAFHAIDSGHPSLDLVTGYNGGLFRKDAAIDDLNLDDSWTNVFKRIGDYDFHEGGEVTVDVLGHIFERSITELEKMRVVGLFGTQAAKAIGAMPKSAERKRFGIYYTPPQFTRLIVDETVGKLIAERVESLPDDHAGLHQRVAALRKLTIVDPACGSGAFLIAAYERLEEAFEEIARALRKDGHIQEALNLTNEYPDFILFDNLHGVDLSAESVEITQLALWIRSARKGRPLTDLSNNIRQGNSLIRDKSVHPEAFDWQLSFPKIFAAGGFDAVVGNPPWERMKVQEREFFSLAAPEIASAVNAADRRKLIAAVEAKSPELWQRYNAVQDAAEKTLAYVRGKDANFPLTGRGDVNTYMLFAELARQLVSPTGRVGLLVPSGIATDATTKQFFTDLMDSRTLTALFDFENKRGWFEDVHRAFKFSILLMNGRQVPHESARFVFFAHTMEDLSDPQRQIVLSPKDLKLLNPNTRTCPIFRTKRDAELTKEVYRHIPILIDHNRKEGGNPWGVRFCRIFDQDNAAEHFVRAETLQADGYSISGNHWIKGHDVYLPLYEAKMVQGYDHRAASVVIDDENWGRKNQTDTTTLVQHQNPEFEAIPVYWVPAKEVNSRMEGLTRPAVIGFKKITSATNQRTMIASFLPFAAFVDSLPIALFGDSISWKRQACLLANLNSLAYDFIARQKVGGLHLNFFIVEQLPTLPPDAYDEKCPWDKSQTLEDWIAERVLKLTCTADDMRPLAKAAGFKPGVWKWKEQERAQLRAELDAAYFHLYGLSRDDVDYILGTFQGIANENEKADGEGETRRLILENYANMR